MKFDKHSDILDIPLLHAGTKGMKWGVVKWRKPGGKSGKARAPGRMKQEWDSLKRERHWQKTLKQIDSLSTKKIADVSRRVSLENELKKLSKSKMGTGKDKKDYRLRGKMSDQELNRKVTRLRVKNGLNTQVQTATKRQREVGMKIAATGGSILLKYATGKKLTVGELYESVANPGDVKTQATKLMLDTVVKKTKGNTAS